MPTFAQRLDGVLASVLRVQLSSYIALFAQVLGLEVGGFARIFVRLLFDLYVC